jgi:xanthine dehydrogenase accessory factor
MVVDAAGTIEGSVTGGCVEAALATEAEQVLQGRPARLVSFGISDELAGTVGLMCGGTVEVLVARLDDQTAESLRYLVTLRATDGPAAFATLIDGDRRGRGLSLSASSVTGSLGLGERLDASVVADARGLLAQGQTMVRRYGADGTRVGEELGVFIHSFGPPPRVIICGAVDFSIALARQARELGYRVTICDPRRSFLNSRRLRAAAEVVCEWPDSYIESQELTERDAVLVFTHDPKFDEPAAIAAVKADVGYIGALGSRRTNRDRTERLRRAGLSDEELARIVCPAGLDIGSSTPAETAVSILAEMTALRRGRAGGRLIAAAGPIRARVEESSAVGGG